MKQTSIPQNNQSPNHNPDMPPKAEAGSTAETGRGPNGRFAKGNRGGPGNPFARQVAAMRQELLKAVTSEDLSGIVRAMIEKAKEGDVAAAKFVLQYTLGKPAQTVDPDRLDEMEWEQWQREVVHISGAHAVFKSCAAETACVLARALVPVLQETMFKGIAATVQESDRQRGASAKPQAADKQRKTASKSQDAASAKPQAASPGAEEVCCGAQKIGAGNETPIESHKDEHRGPKAPAESREDVVARVLRMLNGTVNKPGETARRAANEPSD
jgi:hypothetical protein